MNLAVALSRKHGDVHIARESGGIHLYMASPEGLEQDGAIELQKKHLSVNADKYFASGKWQSRIGTYNNDRCALCMKYDKAYEVSTLLKMVPLSDRGYSEKIQAKVSVGVDNSKFLVDDGKGNLIPEAPGIVIPVNILPDDHPAADYLLKRGYNLSSLVHQFDTSYCMTEMPEDRVRERFWRKLPGGFKDTPQGRIIFFGDMLGVRRGWQARVLSYNDGATEWYYHPYDKAWTAVKNLEDGEWKFTSRFEPMPAYNREPQPFDPSKYRISKGASRNKLILGLDMAIAWNKAHRKLGKRVVIITEGPLDAGKFGPPAVAILGKYLSDDQSDILTKHFDIIMYVSDNDKAGLEGAARIQRKLADKNIIQIPLPTQYKDPGELPLDEAWALFEKYLP